MSRRLSKPLQSRKQQEPLLVLQESPISFFPFCPSVQLILLPPFSSLRSYLCLSSHVNQHHSLVVSRAVGHFSLPSFSTYTTPSTLFAWLWMWAASPVWQCVCDLVSVISQGLTHNLFLIRNI